MIFYTYDKDTKELLFTQQGELDPLESENQGKDVYLVPANSTDIKPTLEPSNDNEMLVFNGEGWELKPRFELNGIYNTIDNRIYEFCKKNGYHLEQVENGFKICAPKEKTFEEVKSDKLSDLASKAQDFENNVNKEMWFKSSVNGYLINGDRRTRSNLEDLITYSTTDTIQLRDYENIERQLTKEQLQVMLKELCINGQLLYEQKWAFEDKINACTTIEELNAIKIKFTMKDFSKEEIVADE